MLVGNDLVCLKTAGYPAKYREGRFMRKIFTEAETEFILSSDDSRSMLWAFWSIKESACKIHQKISGRRRFSPKSMVIDPESVSQDGRFRLFAETSAGGIPVHSLTTLTNHYIATFGVVNPDCLPNVIHQIISVTHQENPSENIRAKLRTDLAMKWPEKAKDIIITRSVMNIPRLEGMDSDLSLSHHGNFASYALLTNNPYEYILV